MSISTFMGLETTLRGLLAQQRALDITAHNIANTNTQGYTRQQANLTPTTPLHDLTTGYIGSGVNVESYTRQRDAFVDVQLRAQNMKTGYADARNDGLTQVELALHEPGDNGISSLLQKYWSAWGDVANSPESLATRQALVQSGETLAGSLRELSSQLTAVQSQAGQNTTLTIADINAVGSQFAQLNTSIVAAKAAGGAPNDLLDKRDVLLDQLSSFANTSWTENADGSVDVTVGGAALVTGQTASTLVESDFTSLTAGKLDALVELRDTTVPGYLANLNAFAKSLADRVNAQHAAGYDKSGTAGGAFFSYTVGAEAATFAVAAPLAADPSLVAASDTPGAAGLQAGNGGNAILVGRLRGDPTVDGAYAQLVTDVGAASQDASRALSNSNVLADSISQRRASLSGVSLDEEMTNLMKYQRGFQAASRALNAMDDMLELLITRTGRVGA